MDTEPTASTSQKRTEKHHAKEKICFKRPSYRESKWERAVKVYTINQESKYLIIVGVPVVGATKELLERFALYGEIEEYRHLDDYPVEEFTEAYWIKYRRIQSARFGKKKMDNRSFFGGLLHVCYAPEYESVKDTREKLLERKRMIFKKCQEYYGNSKSISKDIKSARVHSSQKTNSISSSTVPLPSPRAASQHVPLQHNQYLTVTKEPKKSVFPDVPTQQATLPIEIQDLATEEVYPNQETSLSLQQKKTPSVDRKKENKKKIIWNANAPSNPLTHAHIYTKEPGAWNPFPGAKRRPKDEEVTHPDIRKKMLQTAEPSKKHVQVADVSPLDLINTSITRTNDQIPSKRKRPNDGRKRI